MSALRAWCAWLTEHGYLTENPARRFKLVGRTDPPAPHSLSHKQVHALLRQAAKTRHPARDLALVQLMLQTGIRIGECAALTWGDVRFGEKQGQVLIRRGKGNKARSIPLNTSARTALAVYVAPILQVEPTLKAVARAWSSHPNGPLWVSQKGGQLSMSAIGRIIDDLVRTCKGLPGEMSAHWLRHTFATRYLAAHGDLVGLARLLGHASLDTTSIYVQPTEEQLARLVEELWISMPMSDLSHEAPSRLTRCTYEPKKRTTRYLPVFSSKATYRKQKELGGIMPPSSSPTL